MNILVTGGAGYIGSVCVEQLLDSGHKVVVFDSLVEGHRSAIDTRARFVLGDLSSRDAISATLRDSNIEAVMHFAAHALVGESMQNPTKYFRNNVSNGINLLDASVENRVRKVIFSSTCATYGIPETLPVTEGTPQIPVNPYGESKLIMERILKWYHQIHGMEFTALRYFNAAGASAHFGEHHRIETHLVPNLLFVALGNKAHAEIYGTDYATPDGTCVRDYVHVADISRAHELALRSDVHGCFNLGTGIGFSVREVHRVCEEISGRKIHIIEKTRRSGDPARLVATATLANAKLGWIPQFTRLDKIVETAWNWHLRYPQGYSD